MGTSPYQRPMLTVDVAALTGGSVPHVLLVQRAHPPFAGEWALPGGFVDEGELVAQAAARELAEETGLKLGSLCLLGVYDNPGRDPRGWTVSVAYFAPVPAQAPVTGADDARGALVWSRHPPQAGIRPRHDHRRRPRALGRGA